MKISLIICSYGRPTQLKTCLATLDIVGLSVHGRELILVYTKGDDATLEVMKEYSSEAKCPVKILHAEKRGLSVARNAGIGASQGDLLIFTDDDCLMPPGYIDKVVAEMSSGPYAYGGGSIHNPYYNSPGEGHVKEKTILNPYTLIAAGAISGGNMFIKREVFNRLGGFRQDMGASSGTDFVGAEDLEMVTRASLAGFAGIISAEAINTHLTNRLPGSREAKEIGRLYDIARGSHYAWLMMRGIHEAWGMWTASTIPNKENRNVPRATLERLRHEFEGAYKYLSYCLDNNIDLPPQ